MQEWKLGDLIRPHSFDYKVAVRGDRIEVLLNMLAAAWKDPASAHFELKRLTDPEFVDYRRYTDMQEKSGLFLQASCILTDGAESGVARRVLCSTRSATQTFSKDQERRLSGVSCLWGTALADRTMLHGSPGQLPHAIFNSIDRYSPVSVFGRKLLLPEPDVDSRFLGIGFNLKRSSGPSLPRFIRCIGGRSLCGARMDSGSDPRTPRR